MFGRYSEALDARTDLWKWLNTDQGHLYIEYLLQDKRTIQQDVLGREVPYTEEAELSYAVHTYLAPTILDDTGIYYWPAETCDLIGQVADSLPSTTMRLDMVPSRLGFLWFEKPYDVGRSLTNSPRSNTLLGIMWNIAVDPKIAGASHVTIVPIQPGAIRERGVPAASLPWLLGRTVDEIVELTSQAIEAVRQRGEAYTTAQPRVEWVRRILQILLSGFLFMEQHITVSESKRADKATLKRTEKARPNAAVPDINVVFVPRVTRTIHVDGEARQVEWSHRWAVRGHWRQQYYRSTDSHRPRWINPYIKGPDDKELVVKPTVFVARDPKVTV